jgi:hypothetical protein
MNAQRKTVKANRNPQGFIHPRLIQLETDYLEDEASETKQMADWYIERQWGELEARETAHNRGM